MSIFGGNAKAKIAGLEAKIADLEVRLAESQQEENYTKRDSQIKIDKLEAEISRLQEIINGDKPNGFDEATQEFERKKAEFERISLDYLRMERELRKEVAEQKDKYTTLFYKGDLVEHRISKEQFFVLEQRGEYCIVTGVIVGRNVLDGYHNVDERSDGRSGREVYFSILEIKLVCSRNAGIN